MKHPEFLSLGVDVEWSDRRDGPMNLLGHEVFDGERRANRAQFLRHHLDGGAGMTVVPYLVHGGNVEAVTSHNPVWEQLICDAIITDRKNLILTMSAGDCPPVVIYDQLNHIVGVMHCGWKPLSHNIVENTIEKMRKEYNTDPGWVKVLIGPGICKECYEVGEDVIRRLKLAYMKREPAKWYISLSSIIRERLVASGVHTANIITSPECTYHTEDPKDPFEFKYFSARREKSNPLTCQMVTVRMVDSPVVAEQK